MNPSGSNAGSENKGPPHQTPRSEAFVVSDWGAQANADRDKTTVFKFCELDVNSKASDRDLNKRGDNNEC
jgi:hypothetical protein